MTMQDQVAILILGAGWTSTFLIPLLEETKTRYTATSTTGRPGTQKFKYDPSSSDPIPFKSLPIATTVLITFPLYGANQSSNLVNLYKATHPTYTPHFIQLGSSGIYQKGGITGKAFGEDIWVTRHSEYDTSNARAIAEDELLGLGGTVLNLSGLWGGARQVRHFIPRAITSKQSLASKTSLHMIHGLDVARSILSVHHSFDKAGGQRWLLTDGFVYDWWSLVAGWGDGSSSFDNQGERGEGGKVGREGDKEGGKEDESRSEEYKTWVLELMNENGVRGLPRAMEDLGRCYDVREFWTTFKLVPLKARI